MRDQSETRLQMAVASYLRGEIGGGRSKIRTQSPFPGLVWLHPVNEFKDEKEGMWGKAKGILPGAADLLFWWLGGTGAIELKTKSYLAPNQKDFKANFEGVGGKWALCKKVSEVRDTLISWGLECKNSNCIEPKLSHNELLALQAEIYKND